MIFLVDGEVVNEWGKGDPVAQVVGEHFPPDTRDVAEEVADGPAKRLVGVKGC